MESNHTWDVVVVGGGPAGLAAALMLGRARRRVLVIDAGSPRNRFASHMHGVLGHDGLDPAELTARGRAEVAAYGVEVRPGRAEHVARTPDGVRVTTDEGEHTARALIAATGVTDDLPDVPGLAERWGSSVLHCPYCHGWEVRDQRLGVLLTSPTGLHQAELVRQWSDDVTVFTSGVELEPAARHRLRSRGVHVVDATVLEVLGDGDRMKAVRTTDGDVAVDALFTAATLRPHDGFLAGLALARTDSPFGDLVQVDATGRTSDERVWAVGNVVTPTANVPMVVGAGTTAGALVNAALVGEEFDAAVADATHGTPHHGHGTGQDALDDPSPATFWEERYAGSDRVWSGRPNHTLVDVAGAMAPGRALDLGCGEGADALWLAQQGWTVTGLDISPTAISRATQAARSAGLPPDRVRFVVADLDGTADLGDHDLVTASFLHSPVALARTEVLRRGAGRVAPGGHLLVVGHAAAPPWAGPDAHEHVFLGPQDELDALALSPEEWETVLAEVRARPATGPDGQEATLDDTVVLLRRRVRTDG